MSERSDRIHAWRALVRADPLKGRTSCLLVANQLSQNTNKEEFERTGRLITFQGIDRLVVVETGLSKTMVRECMKRLATVGRILKIETGGGRGRSNRYELSLETLHTYAPFPAAAASIETLHSEGLNPPLRGSKPYTRVHPNKEHRTKERENDIESSAPRPRAVALGALDALDADMRQHLREKAKWVDAAKPVEFINGVLTLSVLTPYQGDNIRKHCLADILAVTGATELKFEVNSQPTDRRSR